MHLRKKILSVVLAGAMIGGELVTGIGSFTLPVNAADSSFAGEEWYDQIDKWRRTGSRHMRILHRMSLQKKL